jgi:hypothetical protein
MPPTGEEYEFCKEHGFLNTSKSSENYGELIISSLIIAAAVVIVFLAGLMVGRYSVLKKRDNKQLKD